MTLLFRDTLFQKHETGWHPEMPKRLQSIDRVLQESGLIDQCTVGEYEPTTDDFVGRIHDTQQWKLVKEMASAGGGHIDADTIVSPESYLVALAAAGACITAIDKVLEGKEKNALCLVRPPGHHATQNRSMGFCLFNNIALAAEHARRIRQLNRILIVDWDVHHGNGTQDIFYEDSQITFLSIHRYGPGFYPGTGAADETGAGDGLGHTINIPITYGISRNDYFKSFESALEKAATKSKPELILLSAGFDAHALDPIGSLGLEMEDFVRMSQSVVDLAKSCTNGRLVSCLEGGYHLQALAESVQAHLNVLINAS